MSSLTFSNFFFIGLLAPIIFIPIVIHLLNKKFPDVIHFSSIHFIKAALRRKSRLFKLRDWLMILLRMLILCFLVFIFSKPNLEVFGSTKIINKKRELIILFDNSLSMQYEKGGITPFKKGIIEIEKILSTATGSDLVNIVNTGPVPIPLEPESTVQITTLVSRLRNIKPRESTADFSAAIAWALAHFQSKSNLKEIYIVSDFQRQTWGKVKLLQFDGQCFYVNVGSAQGENLAIMNASLENSLLLKEEPINLEATIGNFSENEKTIPVSILVNDIKILSQEITLTPWSTIQKTFTFKIKKAGNYHCAISIPDDYLKADNRYYFTINIKDKEKILIITDEENNAENPAFFLIKALNPYGQNEGNYLPEVISLSALSPISLTGIAKIFISRIEQFSPEKLMFLKQFILNGGSVVYFLDGKVDAENLIKMESDFENLKLSARISTKQNASKQGFGARKFLKGDFNSPFLKIFDGAHREKLSHLKFYEYYFSATNNEKGVLLYYDDNSPALFMEAYGQGKILFCNFSVNELESNIARHDVFPVWIQEITRNLTNSQTATQIYELYQSAIFSTDSAKLVKSKILAPDGTVLTDKSIVSNTPGKIRIKFEQQGIYRIELPHKEELAGVNVTTLESDIRSVDLHRLPKSSNKPETLNLVSGASDYKAIKEGLPLFHYLAISLLMLMAFEVGFQWYCKGKT